MTVELLQERLGIDQATLTAFCRKWRVAELAMFGSVLRDEFREGSDVDVLVTFEAGSRWSLWDTIEMQQELRGLWGREVDLVERVVVERSRNYIRRASILSSAQVIYAA